VKPETNQLQIATQEQFDSPGFTTHMPLLGVQLTRDAYGLRPKVDLGKILAGVLTERIEWPKMDGKTLTLAKHARKLVTYHAACLQGGCFELAFYEGIKTLYAVSAKVLSEAIASQGPEAIAELVKDWKGKGVFDVPLDFGDMSDSTRDLTAAYLQSILTVEEKGDDTKVIVSPLYDPDFYAKYYRSRAEVGGRKRRAVRSEPEVTKKPVARMKWGDYEEVVEEAPPLPPPAKRKPKLQKNQPQRKGRGQLAADPVARERNEAKLAYYAQTKRAAEEAKAQRKKQESKEKAKSGHGPRVGKGGRDKRVAAAPEEHYETPDQAEEVEILVEDESEDSAEEYYDQEDVAVAMHTHKPLGEVVRRRRFVH